MGETAAPTKKKPAKKKAAKPAAAAAKNGKKSKPRTKTEKFQGTPEFKKTVAHVASVINGAMESAGLDIPGLAKKLKLTESRVRQLADGRPISIRTIHDVFAACGKTVKVIAE